MPGSGQRRLILRMLSLMLSVGVLLGACSPTPAPLAPVAETHPPDPIPSAATAPANTGTSTIPPALLIVPSRTATATTPTLTFTVCSPLQDVTLAEVVQPDILKNPFQSARAGMDDGHFGADFAYWSRGTHKQMLGLPVHSVMQGRVAGVIQNRMPYGNAVIIETPLRAVPANQQAGIPTPAPTVQPAPNLFCPPDPVHYPVQSGRSLYLLYAHLDKSPTVSLGQPVSCGQAIGEVGTTGRSVNPHLHLETRAGPAGVTFAEMAHYDNAATENEMGTYCTWRVSGLFQAFDPLEILSLQP